MSNLEAIIDDQKSESVIKTLASVASVSTQRGYSSKPLNIALLDVF